MIMFGSFLPSLLVGFSTTNSTRSWEPTLSCNQLHSNSHEPMRHDQKACPLYGERIEKTSRGGRRKYSCQKCGASINKLLICDRCGTKRVWQGKKGAACSGCGAPYTR